jgi:hypothetical protein
MTNTRETFHAASDLEKRILRLVSGFPTLRAWALAQKKFDPALMLRAAETRGSGATHAALFALQVWNLAPGFNVVEAMGTWDAEHRRAFVEWVKNPWWA